MNLSTLGSPTSAAVDQNLCRLAFKSVSVLFLFLIFAQALRWFEEPLSPAWSALEKIKEPLAIAILGDSRSHVGISPSKISASFGPSMGTPFRVYNFSVDGTDALHHASFGVHGLLQGRFPPAVILWATNPLGFNAERGNNRLEQLMFEDVAMLWKKEAPLELLLDLATAELFSPYRQRAAFKRALTGFTDHLAWYPVHFQTRLLGFEYRPLLRARETLHLESGYQPFEIIRWRDAFERGAAEYARKYRTARLSELHLNAARELLHVAKRAGACVVIIEMPVDQWFLNNLAGSDFHREWRRRMEILAREEGAIYLQHAEHGPSEGEFGDPGHMNHRASVVYSEWLAGELRGVPAVVEILTKRGFVQPSPVME